MSNRKELATAVYQLLDKTADSKRLARSIAGYLLATRQSKDVGALLRDVESLRLTRDGILEVHLTSARPLSQTAKHDIKKLFDASHTIIHEQHDPQILGGVKVRAHDKQLDYSVRTRLQRLKAGV